MLDSRRLRGVLYLGFSIALLSLTISAIGQSSAADPLAGGGDMSFLVPSASALPEEAEANTVGPVPGAGVDYTSIQEAIDGSKPGDVIRVLSGNYSENVEVNKTAIVLRGVDTGGGKPAISGDGVGSTITLSADGCTLEGFVVMNSGNPHAGIDVRSNGNSIASNTIRWNRGYGIFVSNSTNNTLERNSISNNGFDGIFLLGSLGNDIFGNTVNSNKMNGIRLVDSDENTIESNSIVNNALYGLLLERSNRNVIRENTILHNLKGGIRLVDSTGNIITKNNYDDISLENSEGNAIEDNNQIERYGDDESDPSDEENDDDEEPGGDDEERIIRVHQGEKIQKAIDDYGSIYKIEVESGTYNENVDVGTYGTVLQGINTGGGVPVINGGGSGDTVTMSGGGSTIDGFKVENSGNPHAGILVISDGNVISNLEVTGNKGYGIHVLSNGNTIDNCVVEGNGNNNGFDAILLGVEAAYPRGNTISGCVIVGGAGAATGGGHGILLDGAEFNTITKNQITGGDGKNGGRGIHLVSSSSNSISENTILGGEGHSGTGGHGISLEFESNNNEIRKNSRILGQRGSGENGYGIDIGLSDGNEILENEYISGHVDFTSGGYGISISGSNNNKIKGNSEIHGDDAGIVIIEESSNNEISGNREIAGNQFDGVSLEDATKNEISDNELVSGPECGVNLYGSDENVISGNRQITGGESGVHFEGSNNNRLTGNRAISGGSYGVLLIKDGKASMNNIIKGNAIVESDCGIFIYGCGSNTIYLNRFENKKNAGRDWTFENLWSSPEEMTYQYKGEEYTNLLGNYWDDYNGYDRNDDGIGDVPYIILPDSQYGDYFPIIDPAILEAVDLIDPLFVEKTASVSEVERGETVTYTIRLYNTGDLPATDIVVKDVFSREVEFTSVSPPPDPDGLWRFDEIGPGESETITLVVKVPKQDLEYKSASRVSGVGFVNVEGAYKTSFEPYVLRNEVSVTFFNQTLGGNDSARDFEDVSVLAERGTELCSREHGSGRYESDELVEILTENRSISMDKEVFASYEPVTLGLYRNRTVTYSSRWAEEACAKNRVTGTSMSESYRYATSIDRESTVLLDKNESTMDVNSEFDGTGHFSLFKTEGLDSSVKSPDFEFLEDYTGSFRVYEKLDQYGSSVTSEKSASGEGLVSTDKRLGESQRSHESGSGTYESEEVIATSTSYIAKDLDLVSGPTSTRLTEDLFVNSSMRWNEGIWSKVENRSLISENYASLDRLDKETVARGLNTMETEANFSGRARYRTILAGQADFDEVYEGDYSLERKVLFRGVSKYDLPHLNVTKAERIVSIPSKNGVFANYMITIENDGNQDFSPVYVKDLFPPGAEYVNSSMRPALGSASATWTLTHLDSGERHEIDLWLNITECHGEMLVNRVEATGLFGDQSVAAGNSSSSEIRWLRCCGPESSVAVTKTAYVSSMNPNRIWYLVEVQNKGDSTKVVKITDTLPKGMTLLEASPEFAYYENDQVSWNLIDLGPKETRIIIYEVEVLWSGTFESRVSISVESVDGGVEASTATTSVVAVDEFAGELAEPGWTTPDWDFEYAASVEGSL